MGYYSTGELIGMIYHCMLILSILKHKDVNMFIVLMFKLGPNIHVLVGIPLTRRHIEASVFVMA